MAAPSPDFDYVLERLRAGSLEYFGAPEVWLQPLEGRRGRYGRVLRVGVETRDRRFAIFLKRFTPVDDTPQELARQRACLHTEYERTLQARAAYADRTAIGVARPIARFEEAMTLVTEEAPGVGLDVLLKRLALRRTRAARQAVLTALERVGEWLRVFQAGVPVADPSARKDYRRYLAVRLRELHRTGAISDAERDTAMATFDSEASRLPPADLAPVAAHADLCPPNILVAPDRVTVIDLAMSVDRARHMDVAFLYMHLALAGRRLYLGESLVRELQDTLLRAYDPALDRRAPAFRLMLLLQVAAHQCSVVPLRPRGIIGAFGEWRARREAPWALALALARP